MSRYIRVATLIYSSVFNFCLNRDTNIIRSIIIVSSLRQKFFSFRQNWLIMQKNRYLRCPRRGRHFFLKVPNRYLRWAGNWCAPGSCNVHCQRPSNMPCELKSYICSNDFLANSSKAYKLTSLQFAKKYWLFINEKSVS